MSSIPASEWLRGSGRALPTPALCVMVYLIVSRHGAGDLRLGSVLTTNSVRAGLACATLLIGGGRWQSLKTTTEACRPISIARQWMRGSSSTTRSFRTFSARSNS